MATSGGSFGGGAGRSARLAGAGGTPGGFGTFFLGFAMSVVGGYLLLNRVEVHSSPWRLGPYSGGFGITLIPLALGIGILFFNGRSWIGKLLTVAGALMIGAGVLMNLDLYFQRTTLFNTLVMITLLVGGLGLMLRSFRSYDRE